MQGVVLSDNKQALQSAQLAHYQTKPLL